MSTKNVPGYSGGPKSDQNFFARAKKRKDNPKATPNQKKTRAGNTVDAGPSNNFRKRFGMM